MRIALKPLLLAGILGAAPASLAGSGEAMLYKDPQCGCEAYADHLRANGFAVTVEAPADLALIKRRHGVPGAPDLRLAQADLPARASVGASVAIRG